MIAAIGRPEWQHRAEVAEKLRKLGFNLDDELVKAALIASRTLDKADSGLLDPDGEEAILARQFIRTLEAHEHGMGLLTAATGAREFDARVRIALAALAAIAPQER